MYGKTAVAICFSRFVPQQTFLTALVASAVFAIAVPARAQSTGSALCDEYLAKYEACLSPKLSPEGQSKLRQMVDNLRKDWTEAAKTESGRRGVEIYCKSNMLKENCAP